MKLKRMRFNLRFPDPRGGGNFVTIHSVKELRDGLMERIIACDDLFDYFKSGQLHRWLECLGKEDEETVRGVRELFDCKREKPVADFAEGLLKTLGIEVDEDVVNDFVLGYITCPEKMLQDKMGVLKCIDEYKTKVSTVIEEFRKDKSYILKIREDLKALRKYILQMFKIYGGLSTLEVLGFVEFLKEDCPLGALALLTLPEGQKYKDDFPDEFKRFIVVKNLNNEPTLFLNENTKLENNHSYLLSGVDAPIKVYRKKRNSWETIVQTGKKVLLLWDREYVVSDVGVEEESDQFTGDKVNGVYQVFNGLDVVMRQDKDSAFMQPFLVYMEVPNDGD